MTGKPEPYYCSALTIVPAAAADAKLTPRAALLNATFWGRHRTLTVGFFDGSPDLRKRVAVIANEWISKTRADLAFHFWTHAGEDPQAADIRIGFNPALGSWSWVGNQARKIAHDRPTMNLGWISAETEEAVARKLVLHEFGHALGLIHEHLHPLAQIPWRKDEVIRDLKKTQDWDEATIAANMFDAPDPSEVFATDPDPSSIMIYPIPAHWTEDGRTVSWNSDLSAKDILLIRNAYGIRQ